MSSLRSRIPQALRRAALPLASYYAVTLALPIAGGALPSAAFLAHALPVLLVPLLLVFVACGVHAMVRGLSSRGRPLLLLPCSKWATADSQSSRRRRYSA
jgi:VIT1/CCC1 family predicted Fe2+/Mn2+ transporter